MNELYNGWLSYSYKLCFLCYNNAQFMYFSLHHAAPLRPPGNLPPRLHPRRKTAQSGPVPSRLPADPLQAPVLWPCSQPCCLPTPGRQGGAEGQGRSHRLHQGHFWLWQLNRSAGSGLHRGATRPRVRHKQPDLGLLLFRIISVNVMFYF